MALYVDLADRVQELGFGNDLFATQLEMLQRVVREVGVLRDWTWLEARSPHTVPANNTDLWASNAAPADMQVGKIVRIQVEDPPDSNEFTLLDQLTWPRLQELAADHFSETSSTVPRYWSYGTFFTGFGVSVEQRPHVWPRCTRAVETIMYYMRQPIPTGAVQPFSPPEYDSVYIWGCARALFARERDWEGYREATREYTRLLEEMIREDRARQKWPSNRVVKTDTHSRWEIYDDGVW